MAEYEKIAEQEAVKNSYGKNKTYNTQNVSRKRGITIPSKTNEEERLL